MFEAFKKKETIGITLCDELKFSKLREHVGEEFTIYGFFINSGGKYGDSVTVITSPETGVNLPKRYAELFRNLTNEEIDAIVSGKCKITNISEIETKQGDTVTFDIVVDSAM